MTCSCVQQAGVTFHVDLSGRGVGAVHVGGEARVAPRVFFKSLGDDQRVEVAVADDLNVGAVLQLFALTEPPANTHSDTHTHSFETPGEAENKQLLTTSNDPIE